MCALPLFLYGTLQPAADTPMARWLAPRIARACPAHVPGRLVAMPDAGGWYPALVPGCAGARCCGTLVWARLTRDDRMLLDHYEGSEYRRRRVRARDAAGTVFAATAYAWCVPLPADIRPIPDGDFLAWLAREGVRAFTA